MIVNDGQKSTKNKNGGKAWHCGRTVWEVGRAGQDARELEVRLGHLEAKFTYLSESVGSGAGDRSNYVEVVRQEAVPAMLDVIKQKLKQLKKLQAEQESEFKEKVKKIQEEEMRELKDAEARKNNFIAYGAPESTQKDKKKWMEEAMCM